MTSNSLAFHSLTFVPERDDVMVGRPDIDSYAVFPADGAALLRRLQTGEPPTAAAAWYESEYGQPIDIEDFVATLDDLGFVRAGASDDIARPDAPVRFQRLGRAAFSAWAAAGYTAIVIAGVLTLFQHAELRPHPRNLFFSHSLLLVQAALLLGELPGVAWHELFHVLAGRRLGVPSRMRLSHRLYFVVVETSLDGLLGVPRRKRYLPFLAGMLADAVFFSLLTLGAAAAGTGSWPGRLALALAYITVLRLAWQLYLFLRTDLYYVFSTATGCIDLHGATRAYVRNRFWQLAGRPDRMVDERAWGPRDRAIARWYAPLALLGMAFLTGVVLVGVVPLLHQFAVAAMHGLLGGGFGPRFWDSLVAVLAIAVQAAVLLALTFVPWIRRRRRALAARPLELVPGGEE
jgi:hypothetical protein